MQRWVLGMAMVVLFCGGRDVSASVQTQGQQGIETVSYTHLTLPTSDLV